LEKGRPRHILSQERLERTISIGKKRGMLLLGLENPRKLESVNLKPNCSLFA